MVPRLASLVLFFAAFFLLTAPNVVQASPLAVSLVKRGPIITYSDAGRVTNVTDPSTGVPITQGDATDGSGSGLDSAAIIWLAWSFVVGVPLMLAGIRLWRFTTGVGIGLSLTVCSMFSCSSHLLRFDVVSSMVRLRQLFECQWNIRPDSDAYRPRSVSGRLHYRLIRHLSFCWDCFPQRIGRPCYRCPRSPLSTRPPCPIVCGQLDHCWHFRHHDTGSIFYQSKGSYCE